MDRSRIEPDKSYLRDLGGGRRQLQDKEGYTVGDGRGREERERELGRMVTGDLNTTAGLDLARALLDEDFDE